MNLLLRSPTESWSVTIDMLREELCANLASVNRIARIGAIWDVDYDLTLDPSRAPSAVGALRDQLRQECDDRVRGHFQRFIVKWQKSSADEIGDFNFDTKPELENYELKEVNWTDFSGKKETLNGYENTALFSYAHADNNYHNEILTVAASVLNEAAYIHSGKNNFLEIVYDLRNIDLGDNWKDKIDQMIDRATIFIPILSPAYFSSEHCMYELEQFSKKMERSSGRGLIMPVHFVGLEELQAKKNPTIEKLLERQHAKWGWLRFKVDEIKKSERVTEEIDEFGLGLVRAISRINQTDGS